MINQLPAVADILATYIGIASALILVVGAIVALMTFVRGVLLERHAPGEDVTQHHINPVRVELGRYITLALEFLIAKDILETLFQPGWSEIGQLAALVAIRTVIGFFLTYEIELIKKRRS